MSDPLARPDVEEVVPADTGAVEKPTDDGAGSPRRPSRMSEAGAAERPPQLSRSTAHAPYDPERAISLLVETVVEMESTGRNTSAAGVSARMVRADPEFRPARAGFTNFRALLGTAQARGLVDIHKPAGASDITVASITGGAQEAARPATSDVGAISGPRGSLGGWLRRDLWRALRDFSTARYGIDRTTLRTTPLSGTHGLAGSAKVPVPVLTPEEQAQWIREFVEQDVPPAQRPPLLAALDDVAPGQCFDALIAGSRTLQRRWDGFLRRNLMSRAQSWAASEGLSYEDLLDEPRREAAPNRTTQAPTPNAPSAPSRHDSDEQLRTQILGVLSDLPLAELLKLPVPLEYTLRR